jgi:sRNA-binding protein
MSELSKEKLRIKRNAEILNELRITFPGAFPQSNKDIRVLAIGIIDSLVSNGYIYEDIRGLLRSYCNRNYYHEAFLTQSFRVDLNGDPTTEITEDQRLRARKCLDAIAAKKVRKQQSKKLEKELKAKKDKLNKVNNKRDNSRNKFGLNKEVVNKSTGRRVLVLSKKEKK